MLSLPIQERFRQFITPHIQRFLDDLGYEIPFDRERVTVRADLDTFNYKEDVFVWGQKRDKIPRVFQVYVDGIHVCYLSEDLSKQQVLRDFWQGFLKAYQLPDDDSQKIWLDESIYLKKTSERKEQQKKHNKEIRKAIEDKKVTSNLEAQAKELALDVFDESSTAS